MGKTKKVKLTGKFGPRYGLRTRNTIIALYADKEKKSKCSRCLKMGVVRMFAGAWKCDKCGIKFTGKAYKP